MKELNKELARVHAYAQTLSALAKSGDNTALDLLSLQVIFADVAKVTAAAYIALETQEGGDN